MAQKETPWFYHPDLSNTLLSKDETRHATSALRLQTGARVMLTTGQGKTACARLMLGKKEVINIEIEAVTEHVRSGTGITVIIGRLHQVDRLEWLVEKLQEIGIAHLWVAEMDNCGPGKLSTDRLQRIAISALKQSHQPWLIETHISPSLAACLPAIGGPVVYGYQPEHGPTQKIQTQSLASSIVVGPEADFSHKEVAWMQQQGWQAVSIGNTRLRTETAALAGAVFLHICD